MTGKESLPEVLTARDISQIMRCSVSKAYDLMELKGFPLIRVGKIKRVEKESFFNWLSSISQSA